MLTSPKSEAKPRIADLSTAADGLQPPAVGLRYERVSIRMGWGGSRLYPHMRAKFGRGPTAVSKKVFFKFISRSRYLICKHQ